MHTIREARIVLYIRGDSLLAARLQALEQQRLEVGAGGVDGCGVAGGTRTDDDDVANFTHVGALR